VDAFVKGLRANSFNESLVKNLAISLAEVRLRASIHIETEDVIRHRAEPIDDTLSKSRIFCLVPIGYGGNQSQFYQP